MSIELHWQILLPWFALATVLLTATRADPDLWGHLRFGLDWLQSHTLPSADPYSFTQDKPWVNHEWASEAITAAAFTLGGTAGLVLMKAAVMAAPIAVLWRRLTGSTPLVKTVVSTLAIIAALPLSGTVRPQIWSAIALALLTLLLDGKPPSSLRIVAGAALFAAWANLHGGWITGSAVLGLYAVVRTLRTPQDAWRWLALVLASLAGTLLNPYGVGLWHFLATTVRSTRPDIAEWASFSLKSPPITWVSVVTPVAVLALLARHRQHRPPLEVSAAVLLMVIASVRVSRVGPLVCTACLALLGPSITAAWGRLGRLVVPSRAAAGILFLPAAVTIVAAYTPVSKVLRCMAISDSWAPDRLAAAQLQGVSGRLWTTFNWGEYAIWHFGPDLRVSVDGRRETVYSDATLAWTRAAESGEPDASQRMFEIAPEFVWLPSSRSAIRALLEQHGYRVDVDTGTSFIAVRADLPQLPTNSPALPDCFP
jgi:hypothetical protein